MARNGNRNNTEIPDLEQSLDRLVESQRVVAHSIPFHSDIYDAMSSAVDKYKGSDKNEQAKAALRRSLHFGVYTSIVSLLHDKKSGADGGFEEFTRDVTRYKDSMDARLDYVEALIVSAVETENTHSSLNQHDLGGFRKAKRQLQKAIQMYEKPKEHGVSRAGQEVTDMFRRAYDAIDQIRLKATEAYDII